MITQEQIEQLSRLRNPHYPVTSLFLNLNGGRDSRKASIVLKDLVKARRVDMHHLTRDQLRSVEKDFEQLERYLQGFDRRGTRALAVFSSSGVAMWQAFPLARRVKDRLIVDTHPHIRPLSRLLNEFKRCGVVLVSRDRASIDYLHLGQIRRLESMSGDVAPHVRESGFQGYEERRIERHADDEMRRFIKEVANRAVAHQREQEFDYVVLGGSAEPMTEFEDAAHRYLRERIIGRLALTPESPESEVLEHASNLVLAEEERRARVMADRLIQDAAAGGRAVIGIEPTLASISHGRIATLVVEKDTLRPGLACGECSFLSVSEAACPRCGADFLTVPDIIEEAVDRTLALSASVLFVAGHEELARQGGLAAALRY